VTIPALPDSQRISFYTISSSAGPLAVGFQIYGDQTDIDAWVQVWLNATRYLSTDPTFGWTLTSPSGSLSVIARPITDAVISFNSPQTGTVAIIGAQRPRRLSEYAENTGVSAASLNLLQNTVFAELRENFDFRQIIPSTTFANLVVLGGPPPLIGRLACITDGAGAGCADGTCTTWGTNVTAGGGTLPLLIWYNGSHWTLIGK
jgi:hypothetical protein